MFRLFILISDTLISLEWSRRRINVERRVVSRRESRFWREPFLEEGIISGGGSPFLEEGAVLERETSMPLGTRTGPFAVSISNMAQK
jgi:hypothetical protein